MRKADSTLDLTILHKTVISTRPLASSSLLLTTPHGPAPSPLHLRGQDPFRTTSLTATPERNSALVVVFPHSSPRSRTHHFTMWDKENTLSPAGILQRHHSAWPPGPALLVNTWDPQDHNSSFVLTLRPPPTLGQLYQVNQHGHSIPENLPSHSIACTLRTQRFPTIIRTSFS